MHKNRAVKTTVLAANKKVFHNVQGDRKVHAQFQMSSEQELLIDSNMYGKSANY